MLVCDQGCVHLGKSKWCWILVCRYLLNDFMQLLWFSCDSESYPWKGSNPFLPTVTVLSFWGAVTDDVIVCKHVDRHTGRYFDTSWEAENKGGSCCCVRWFTAMTPYHWSESTLHVGCCQEWALFLFPLLNPGLHLLNYKEVECLAVALKL